MICTSCRKCQTSYLEIIPLEFKRRPVCAEALQEIYRDYYRPVFDMNKILELDFLHQVSRYEA